MTLKAAAMAAALALPFGASSRSDGCRRTGCCGLRQAASWSSSARYRCCWSCTCSCWQCRQTGYTFPVFWQLVLPIVLCSSALLAEVFRAGVLALDSGQSEAGYAIGLRRRQ